MTVPNLDVIASEIEELARQHRVRIYGYIIRPLASTEEELRRELDTEILDLLEWFGFRLKSTIDVELEESAKERLDLASLSAYSEVDARNREFLKFLP